MPEICNRNMYSARPRGKSQRKDLNTYRHITWRRKWQPLQCLENPRDGAAWWAAIYGVAQSWTRLK